MIDLLTHPFRTLWNHPRRVGFISFNLIVLAILIGWSIWMSGNSDLGIAGLPNYMLGYVGIAFLLLAWVIAWVAWIIMLVMRRRRLARDEQTPV